MKTSKMKEMIDKHNDYFENYDLFCCAHCGYNATLKTHKNDFTKSKTISKLHLWHSKSETEFYKLNKNDERKFDSEKWFGFQLLKDSTFNGCPNERKFLLEYEDGSYTVPLCSKCFKNRKTFMLQDEENRNCEKLLDWGKQHHHLQMLRRTIEVAEVALLELKHQKICR